MSNKDSIVDVDGCPSRSELSSDEDRIQSDVETDDSSDQNEAGAVGGSNSSPSSDEDRIQSDVETDDSSDQNEAGAVGGSNSSPSSDEDRIQSDVETDDSSDQNEAGAVGGSNSSPKAGGGNLMGLTDDDLKFWPHKRDHHNKPKKKHRQELNASYARLRKHVKRLTGSCSGGRHKTLEMASKLAMEKVNKLRKIKQDARDMVEKLKAKAANSSGAELEHFKKGITQLTALLEEHRDVIPVKVELADAETQEESEEITDDSDIDGDDEEEDEDEEEEEEEEEEESSEKENDNDDDASPDSSYHFENQ